MHEMSKMLHMTYQNQGFVKNGKMVKFILCCYYTNPECPDCMDLWHGLQDQALCRWPKKKNAITCWKLMLYLKVTVKCRLKHKHIEIDLPLHQWMAQYQSSALHKWLHQWTAASVQEPWEMSWCSCRQSSGISSMYGQNQRNAQLS